MLGIGGGASLNLRMRVRMYGCVPQDNFTQCVHTPAPRSISFDVPHDTMEKLHLRRLIDARPLAIISLYVYTVVCRPAKAITQSVVGVTTECGHFPINN